MANEGITRRDFIKGLAAGAVSIAGLGVLQAIDHNAEVKAGEKAAEAATAPVTPEATSGLTFTPGTYEASAKGIASDVKVKMTFDKTTITDCSIDVSGETPDIGGKVGDEMRKKILTSQSANVDGVSSATVTCDAIKTAAADCISQASGQTVVVSDDNDAASADWLGEAPEIAESDITETLETEVLVVGCGTGGWIATMTAAEEGAKVLTIEKGEGPTTIREDIGAIDSRLQKEAYEGDYPYLKIDKMEALQDILRYAGGYVDSNLIKVWIENSAEMLDWLTDLLEATGDWYMELEGSVGDERYPERDKAYATGHSPHKTATAGEDVTLNSTMTEFAESHGAEFRFSTLMVKLEQDDKGKVTGVIAQDVNDEHYIRIKASKGVIMCAGGYATNTPMMLALQPHTMKMKINVPIGSKADGSGIKAMLWAGAELDPTHASMMFNRASCLPTETAGYKTNGKWYWFGEQPFLKVNLNGDRFCNESGPYEFMLHSMYMQPFHTYVDIFDSNCKKYAEQFQEVGCCRLFPFDNNAISNMGFDYVWGQMTEGENSHLALGYLQKADTIKELAEKLNIPADHLEATVKRYNEFAKKGVDEDYGKPEHRITPVDQPPFYGIRTGAWHLTTLNGCRINTDMQVLREDGTVIEGLWATGDCTGGFFAQTYPNLFTGLACGRTMTFGRRAAKIVAHL